MKRTEILAKERTRRQGLSTIIGGAFIAIIIFVVIFAYFSFEMGVRSSIDQNASQRGALDRTANQEKIIANSSLNSSGNLQVKITDSVGYSQVEIVEVLVGKVNPNSVVQNYGSLQIIISPGQSYSYDTTVKYTSGVTLWAKVVTSLGTSALVLYPNPYSSSSGGGSSTGQIGPSGNVGDINLNFSTFSWYRVASCTPDAGSKESGYCLSPAVGSGNTASTIYSNSTTLPLAFSLSVVDVNAQKLSITLDNITSFLQFQSCGSSICSSPWFITSNVTDPNSNGVVLNHILKTYQQITLSYGKLTTLVFATAPNQPQCTTNCYPVSTFSPVSCTPALEIAPNLIFAHGWEGIPVTQTPNYGQNLPFTSTLYITPQITLSPSTGIVGARVIVNGTFFAPSSIIRITYNGTVLVTTPNPCLSNVLGTFSCIITIPQSSGTNTIAAIDTMANSASASFVIQDFSVTVAQSSTNVQLGQSRTLNNFVKVTSINGFTGTVALTAMVSPSTGLGVTLNPTTVTLGASGTSSLTLTASSLGAYLVTITGTFGMLAHSVSFIVSIPNFALTPPVGLPGNTTTLSGAGFTPSTTYDYCLSTSSSTITCLPGTASSFITDSAGKIPAGAILTVPLDTAAGTYYVIVYTITNYITSVANFPVEDFTITASPTTVAIVAGGPPGNSTITITAPNGFTGGVTLSASVVPTTGLTESLNPTSVTGSGTSTLSFSSSVAGTYTITVTGKSNNDVHTATVTVTVNHSPTSTSVVCNPSSLPGGSATTCTATVTGSAPTGTVTFSQTGEGTGAAFNPANKQCTLSAGSCSVTYTQTSGGNVSISATYGGDANNAGSTSSPFLVVFDVATVVQLQSSSCLSMSCSITFSKSVTAGDVIVVAIATNNNSSSCVTVSGVGDSIPNSYNVGPVAGASSATGSTCSESFVYYALVGSGGSDTVTVALSGTPTGAAVLAYEVSDISTTITSTSGTCNDINPCSTSLSTSAPYSYSSDSFVINVGSAYGQAMTGPSITTTTYAANQYVGYYVPSVSGTNSFTETTTTAPTTWTNLVVQFAVV